jgi:hypothetical protein
LGVAWRIHGPRDGNNGALFSINGKSWEVWKTG